MQHLVTRTEYTIPFRPVLNDKDDLRAWGE